MGKILRTEKWAKGKNPVFAFMAISYAMVARDRCDLLRNIKERRINGHHFPMPEFPSWLSMYHSRKPLFAYKRLITNNSEFMDETISAMGEFRIADKMAKQNPEQLVDIIRTLTPEIKAAVEGYWKKMLSELFVEIKEEIAGEKLSPDLQEKMNMALKKDELPLSFYFLVYAPCFLFYGTSPNDLYRKALKDDYSAIEKLLRIDTLVYTDPAINAKIHSLLLSGKTTNDFEKLIEALHKRPGINFNYIANERKSVKSEYGATILRLAQALKIPMKASEVRHLYDYLAFDFEGNYMDKDIDSPEGFDKTIKNKALGQDIRQKMEKQI